MRSAPAGGGVHGRDSPYPGHGGGAADTGWGGPGGAADGGGLAGGGVGLAAVGDLPVNHARAGGSQSIAMLAATNAARKPPVADPARNRGTASTPARRARRRSA